MIHLDNAAWKKAVEDSVRKTSLAKIKYETNSCWARTAGKVDESQGLHPCDELMSSDLGLCERHHLEIVGNDVE